MNRWSRSPHLTYWLAFGICLSVAFLAWFGFEAYRQSRRSARALLQQRADETARLLTTALNRDMRAVQTSVLDEPTWDDFGPGASHEVLALVANGFARYPYAEAFFAWDHRRPTDAAFYLRTDRSLAWPPTAAGGSAYPVRVVPHPPLASRLLPPVLEDARFGRLLSVAQLRLGADLYQVVTFLKYDDRLRQHLVSARGMMVNLTWARANYFPDLTRQLLQGTGGMSLWPAITDGQGRPVLAGVRPAPDDVQVRRTFALAFFDPSLIADRPLASPLDQWTVMVAGRDSAGDAGLPAINLAVSALAALVLASGLLFVARAMRTAAELAQMRAEFMSSVTHELKTPIGSIQALSDTLRRGRLRDKDAELEYAGMVYQESKRLGRLVDNVLAHARVTDVADVYTFEPLDVDELITTGLNRFRHQLAQEAFSVTVEVPGDIPPVRADQSAAELVLDNLLDNAIRYSGRAKSLRVAARVDGAGVLLEVEDRGIGIPPADLEQVTRKFVRGSNALPGGSGLGLAIVTRIVGDHGGRFAVRSTLGQGTTTAVWFPAWKDRREVQSWTRNASL